MSVTSPPDPNVNIFNNEYWNTDDEAVTIGYANKHYLKFPIAQGKETLQAVDVNGVANFNNQLRANTTLDVSGNATFNSTITQNGVNRIFQTDGTGITNPNVLRLTNLIGDLNISRGSTSGGGLRCFDVTTPGQGGSSIQLFQSGIQGTINSLAVNSSMVLQCQNAAGTNRQLVRLNATSGTLIQTNNIDSTFNPQLRVAEINTGRCLFSYANSFTNGDYNPMVAQTDCVLYAGTVGGNLNSERLVLTSNSTTATGVRITPLSSTIGYGGGYGTGIFGLPFNRTFYDGSGVQLFTNNIQRFSVDNSGNSFFTGAVNFTNGTGTGKIFFDPLAPANMEISCSGDLELRPVGSIDCNGQTLDMTNGRIVKVDDIESPNNVDLNVICKGTADFVVQTDLTERLRITDTGNTVLSTTLQSQNVGINKASTANALDVSGNTLLSTLSVTGATNMSSISTTGNVGINKASTANALDVSGNSLFSGNLTQSGINSTIIQSDISGNIISNQLKRTNIQGDLTLSRPTGGGGAFSCPDVVPGGTGFLQIYQAGSSSNFVTRFPDGFFLVTCNNSAGVGRQLMRCRASDGTLIQTNSIDSTTNAQLRVAEINTGRCISSYASAAATGNYNPIVVQNDNVIFSNTVANTVNTESLVLTTNSTTSSGLRITPTSVTLGRGGNSTEPSSREVFDASNNLVIFTNNTERIRIDTSGNFFLRSIPNINEPNVLGYDPSTNEVTHFSKDLLTSEASFTPELREFGSPNNFTFGARTGYYSKIGKMVTFSAEITITNISLGATGDLTVTLPFTNNTTSRASLTVGLVENVSAAYTDLSLVANANSNQATIYRRTANNVNPSILTAININNNFKIFYSGSYVST